LQRYVPDSPVTVVLTQLQSTRIYVVGKVQRPGMFTVQGEISVLQALALAGGLNRFADEDDIYVLRSSEEEGQKTLPFDYSQVAKGKDLECNIALQPGDTVVVP
jgi:polysaccharide export outer membrane protein